MTRVLGPTVFTKDHDGLLKGYDAATFFEALRTRGDAVHRDRRQHQKERHAAKHRDRRPRHAGYGIGQCQVHRGDLRLEQDDRRPRAGEAARLGQGQSAHHLRARCYNLIRLPRLFAAST